MYSNGRFDLQMLLGFNLFHRCRRLLAESQGRSETFVQSNPARFQEPGKLGATKESNFHK